MTANKFLTYLFFGGLFIALGLMATKAGQYFWYQYAPLDNFVSIEKIEARQINDQTVLHILYREVHQPMRGFVSRVAYCVESDPDREVFTQSNDLEFDQKFESKAEVKVPLSLFPQDCHNFQFKVSYIIFMPDGQERHFEPIYSNVFPVVFPGESVEESLGIEDMAEKEQDFGEEVQNVWFTTPDSPMSIPVPTARDRENEEARIEPRQTTINNNFEADNSPTNQNEDSDTEPEPEREDNEGFVNDEVPIVGPLL